MSKFRLSRFLPVAFVLLAKTAGALPIDHIDLSLSPPSHSAFTAGVTTNTTGSGQVWVFCYTSTNGVPAAGETVFLEIVQGGSNVSGAISPASFTTDGINSLFGLRSFYEIPMTFYLAGTGLTLRARTSSGVTDSVGIDVNAGPAARLVLLAPGLSLNPGHDPTANPLGYTGTLQSQTPNEPFAVTVRMTDNWFNSVTSNDTVSFAALDPTYITLPANGPLTGGVGSFNITLIAPRATRQVTVSDVTNGGILSASLSLVSSGPPEAKVTPIPNPFNPRQGAVRLQFVLDQPATAALTITDPFGRPVWKREVSAVTGANDVLWDGNNDNGVSVAAGYYYVVLEINGSVKSKNKLAVTK